VTTLGLEGQARRPVAGDTVTDGIRLNLPSHEVCGRQAFIKNRPQSWRKGTLFQSFLRSVQLADVFTVEERSRVMSRVASKNTRPEMRVRKAAHAMGLRYALHKKGLPGTPDVAFVSRKLALYVHGCFWHRHDGCRLASTPKSNAEFWRAKFERNVDRDRRVRAELEAKGWTAVVIWECETRDQRKLSGIICERVLNFDVRPSGASCQP
jgi:DNA mismatch endonuclease (patch repair protein)